MAASMSGRGGGVGPGVRLGGPGGVAAGGAGGGGGGGGGAAQWSAGPPPPGRLGHLVLAGEGEVEVVLPAQVVDDEIPLGQAGRVADAVHRTGHAITPSDLAADPA